jgi:glycosyltransferase involved in cell wall biosynthesis
MKVAHIITCLDIGGAETMLTRLLLAAEQPSAGQLVISLKDLGPLGAQLQRAGVQVETVGLGSKRNLFSGCWFLFGLLRRYKPDIVQTWMYHADFLGGLLARLAGCSNVVWGIRGTYTPLGRPWTHRIMRCCAALSFWLPRRILCVAEAARNSHINYGYCAEKMTVISNGLDLATFAAAMQPAVDWRAIGGWDAANPLVGCVGRYHADKGQDLFIAAVAALHQQVPAVRVVMVGRDCDANNPDLTGLIRQHRLDDVVLLAGERRDIPACLAGFDYFCLPSRTEGFPNVLAEAMAAGVPAVACDVGDVRLLAGDTVHIVAAGQSDAIARGIEQLFEFTPTQLAAQAERARSRVEANCSIQAVRRQYDLFYQQMLES